MIVRIQGEGQYRLSSAAVDDLNEIDNKLVEVVANGSTDDFSEALGQMLALVRTRGEMVGLEELIESDVVLPAEDTTLEDAQGLFVGDGVIPG